MSITTATPEEVISKISEAVDLLKLHGKKALDILRDPSNSFIWKDSYLFIIDLEESLVLLNPAFPEREGGNIREHLDWNQKKYGLELCDTANQGGGWIEFMWPKPGTETPLRKISYIYPIPGYRYTVCAGVYNEDISLEEANQRWCISGRDNP